MTVQPPAERPAPGYYPDPSIPGFVRYWDGEAWTPGSARPAPQDGAPLPPPPRVGARGGVRVAPPPPPRPTAVEETGPVFLDETGAAQLIVPQEQVPSVWSASAQAQPGLLDTGPVPRHVTWGVPDSDPTPETAPLAPAPATSAEVDPDDELASALRLALSQTRRAKLPPPVHYEAAHWTTPRPASPPAETYAAEQEAAAPGRPPQRVAAPSGEPAAQDDASVAGRPAQRPASGWAPAGPSALEEYAAEQGGWAPQRAAAPDGSASGGGVAPRRAGAAAPQTGTQPVGRGVPSPAPGWAPAPPPPTPPAPPVGYAGERSGTGSSLRDAGPVAPHGGASPVGERRAPGVYATEAPVVGRPAPAPAPAAPARPGSGRTVGGGGGDAAVTSERVGRAASGVGQRRSKAVRPALLGARIGARLVDTLVSYAVVGVLGVVLVQRVMLHLQAKVDAARASGVPQTVWLVDGTVLANAGLLLAALLVVGVVYETVPVAVWGRTLGKAIFGLSILDARTKARPRLARTFLRTALCQTLVFLLLGILELVPCATDRKLRQSWHDKLGGTYVVKQ